MEEISSKCTALLTDIARSENTMPDALANQARHMMNVKTYCSSDTVIFSMCNLTRMYMDAQQFRAFVNLLDMPIYISSNLL